QSDDPFRRYIVPGQGEALRIVTILMFVSIKRLSRQDPLDRGRVAFVLYHDRFHPLACIQFSADQWLTALRANDDHGVGGRIWRNKQQRQKTNKAGSKTFHYRTSLL